MKMSPRCDNLRTRSLEGPRPDRSRTTSWSSCLGGSGAWVTIYGEQKTGGGGGQWEGGLPLGSPVDMGAQRSPRDLLSPSEDTCPSTQFLILTPEEGAGGESHRGSESCPVITRTIPLWSPALCEAFSSAQPFTLLSVTLPFHITHEKNEKQRGGAGL